MPRQEGINPNLCYRWSKDSLEAGKKRLSGATVREANTGEVTGFKSEIKDLKQAVVELYLRGTHQNAEVPKWQFQLNRSR